jgi:hypothetical protein
MAGTLLTVFLVTAGVVALVALVVLTLGLLQNGRDVAIEPDRRRFTRVPCHFRAAGGGKGGELWRGDLSLGGACVRMPMANLEQRLKVVAVDNNGLAPAATIEGRVVSMQREDGVFVHHLAFDPGGSTVTVAALVAASAWSE